jgi:hypothetical protein
LPQKEIEYFSPFFPSKTWKLRFKFHAQCPESEYLLA